VPVGVLRPLVPEPLRIDVRDGAAWVGVVPFRMEGVMLRRLPDLPWVSAFPELNVRTYVEFGGQPGIWFFSLDATNPLAVWAARRFFSLPYHRADIDVAHRDPEVRYAARRRSGDARFQAIYRPESAPCESRPGTIEHFLTERYCLYALRRDGRLMRADVHHAPWPLQSAAADIQTNTMAFPGRPILQGAAPLLHFARRMDVIVWTPREVESPSR